MRVDVYVHNDDDNLWNQGVALGFEGDELRMFSKLAYEIKLTYEVASTGVGHIVEVDGRPVADGVSTELKLLRKLRGAVEADRVGCVTIQSVYDENGHWLKNQWVSTQDALKALEGIK